MTTGRINQVATTVAIDLSLLVEKRRPTRSLPIAEPLSHSRVVVIISITRSFVRSFGSGSRQNETHEPLSFYRAPLGSSLRGRDLQDGRVRNEDIPVRIDRSGPGCMVRMVPSSRSLPDTATVCSGVPLLSARSSLGLATSLRPPERQESSPSASSAPRVRRSSSTSTSHGASLDFRFTTSAPVLSY